MSVAAGIEAMNAFCGVACLDVRELAEHRGLDTTRFENLLMKEKTVALPCEDPVTLAVNAARPLLEVLDEAERKRIELLITCTESGLDFAKSISTYVHRYLGLSRNCRLFELKNACYSGVAGLQMAANFVFSRTSPGARALVVATDVSRFSLGENGEGSDEVLKGDWSFSEPSGGSGAVAMLVGDQPHVFRIDSGASGYYGYEVMDACRPFPDGDVGDADLSLLSYLDCCENAFSDYAERVAGVDYATSFAYLAFHTPFGGMIKGAHRRMMRKLLKADPPAIAADFERRVLPGLKYCQRTGNTLAASAALSLASTIDNGDYSQPRRIGCFSYGSGCCSEFFSGVTSEEGQRRQRRFDISGQLDRRHRLSIADYERLVRANAKVRFGTRDAELDPEVVPAVTAAWRGTPRLVLRQIRNYQRNYEWID